MCLQVQDLFIFEIAKPLKQPGTIKYGSPETNIQILVMYFYSTKIASKAAYQTIGSLLACSYLTSCHFFIRQKLLDLGDFLFYSFVGCYTKSLP